MQSGRISPVFRQFFQGVTGGKSATDSQSGNKQGQKQEPDREPNREDSLEALDLLTQEEEFQKNALKAELREIEGKFCISVMNSMGAQLRMIRGKEILRLLEAKGGAGSKVNLRGRILDRRI